MSLFDLLETAEEKRQLCLLIARRAAECFEAAGDPLEAAGMWVEAGYPDRAISGYLSAGAPGMAAPLQFAAGHYREALANYRSGLADLAEGDQAGLIELLLGQWACLVRLKAEGWQIAGARQSVSRARL